MLIEPWNISMFGGLKAEQAGRSVERFRTRSVGSLLAFLAFHPKHAHSREILMEMLWPESEIESARQSLRQTIYSLRKLLEPTGVASGNVVITDNSSVRLHTDAFRTDVANFTHLLETARKATDSASRIAHLAAAVNLYSGELLPGFYEHWISAERESLADKHRNALRELSTLYQDAGDLEAATGYTRRAVLSDPFHEEMQEDLIRLLMKAGRPEAVWNQFQELCTLLSDELGQIPSARVRELIAPVANGRTTNVQATPRPRVKSVERPTVPTTQPAASHMSERQVRLPIYLTRFFGREGELDKLMEMLGLAGSTRNVNNTARLITLTGPGGGGKTRLSVEAASHAAKLGVRTVFVPLAGLSHGRLVPDAIADALQLPRQPTGNPLAQVISTLRAFESGQQKCTPFNPRAFTLLILDNAEHLLFGNADSPDTASPETDLIEIVRSLLEQVDGLKCLVTSRQTLSISGEREFAISPLPTPNHPGTPVRLLEFPGVQLFLDRAQEVRADFALTPRNCDAIANLCCRLEGIPLALELAAARVGMLTPQQMLAQMENRFGLLVSRKQDSASRHQTLRSAIDWSFRLLNNQLQRIFVRLSIFRGGWTPEMAAVICGEPNMVECLEQLRDRSLIVVEEAAYGIRCRMLETLREYAWEQLDDDQRMDLRRRHADFFMELAERSHVELRGPDQYAWRERLDAEQDNVQIALETCAESDTGLRLVAGICLYWWIQGRNAEGRYWIDRVLKWSQESPSRLRANVLSRASLSVFYQGETTLAREWTTESLTYFRSHNDACGIADSQVVLATICNFEGDFVAAQTALLDSLRLYRELKDPTGIGDCLGKLGSISWFQADYQSAREYQTESLAIRRDCGDTMSIARSLDLLGHVALYQGDYHRAKQTYEEALLMLRDGGDQGGGITNALLSLGSAARLQGAWAEAESYYKEALALATSKGRQNLVAEALGGLGLTARDQGDYNSAISQMKASLKVSHSIKQRQCRLEMMDGLSMVSQLIGQPERAARLFGATARLQGTIKHAMPPDDLSRHRTITDQTRANLGADAFAEFYAEGMAMEVGEAVEYALETVMLHDREAVRTVV